MDILKGLNLLLRFLLELCMYASVGYWGFKTHEGWIMKLTFGIGLPVLMAVLWGVFLSPKATRPLRGLPREILELILLGSGAIALLASGKANLACIYLAVLLINKVLLVVWKQ